MRLAQHSARPCDEDRLLILHLGTVSEASLVIAGLHRITAIQSANDLATLKRVLVTPCTGVSSSSTPKELPLTGITSDTVTAAIAIATFDRTAVGAVPAYPLAADPKLYSKNQNAQITVAAQLAKKIGPLRADVFVSRPGCEDKIEHVSRATCQAAVGARTDLKTRVTIHDLRVDSETFAGPLSDDDGEPESGSESSNYEPPGKRATRKNGDGSEIEDASSHSDEDDSLEFSNYSSTGASVSSSDLSATERKLAKKLEAAKAKREDKKARSDAAAKHGVAAAQKRARSASVSASDAEHAPPAKRAKAENSATVPVCDDVGELFGDM